MGPGARPIRVCIELDLSWWPLGGRVKIGVKRSPIRTPRAGAGARARDRPAPRARAGGADGLRGAHRGPGRPPAWQARSGACDPLHQAPLRCRDRRAARGGRGRRARGGAGADRERRRHRKHPDHPRGGRGHGDHGRLGLLRAHAVRPLLRRSRLTPAAMFAMPVVRKPSPSIATLLGGGYPASGAAGRDRLPAPHLPPGLRVDPLEGAGEVQTPVTGSAAASLRVGANVYLRHAKAGELCERFNSLYLMQRRRDSRRGADVPRRGPLRALAAARGRGGGLACARRAGLARAERRRDHDRRPDGGLAGDACSNVNNVLGGEGTNFDQTIASFPLCCPSRATHLTGQYAHNHGVLHNNPPFGGFIAARPRRTRCRSGSRRPATGRCTSGRYLNGYEAKSRHPAGLDGLVRQPALRRLQLRDLEGVRERRREELSGRRAPGRAPDRLRRPAGRWS